MRKHFYYTIICGVLCCLNMSAQSPAAFQQIDDLLDDALLVSNRYLSPATDAAVYLAASNWVTTPQKRELWDVSLSVHANVLVVPSSNRRFAISDDELQFFNIENGSSASLPTALGNDDQIYLSGQITDGETVSNVRLKSPEGINASTITYPYIQASVGLLYGTELVARYSTKVKLKKGRYQVYGAGLKHNVSQYFPKLEQRKVFLSAFSAYSREEISFNFLDTETPYGSLGLNEITGKVSTIQFQANISKQWRKFELMSALIVNSSEITYQVEGPKGEIESVLPVQYIINKKLEEIYTTEGNLLGEISGRYQIGKIYLQSAVAFGKFVNANISAQYEF